LLIDTDILIDSGSGVGELTLDEMAGIRHIFLTHSHLDHVGFLPLMVDSIFDKIREPIVIHGQAQTLKVLQEHIFNWHIWPDFATLPTEDHPVMRYEVMDPGTTRTVDGRTLEMIPVNHIVPAVGYRVQAADGKSFAFSGDTSTNDTFWAALNAHAGLDLLIVEAAFANADEELSKKARHYCSNTLAADIVKLKHHPEVYLTHNKPGAEEAIYRECQQLITDRNLKQLKGNEVFEL
jgi:ribonuclease BN (tRNA processing enzyme)